MGISEDILNGMARGIADHVGEVRPSMDARSPFIRCAKDLAKLYTAKNDVASVGDLFRFTKARTSNDKAERYGRDLAEVALDGGPHGFTGLAIPQFSVTMEGSDLVWEGSDATAGSAGRFEDVRHTKTVAETRALLARIPDSKKCSDGCPGWVVSDSDKYGLEVETCDECMSALPKAVRLSDDDVAQLPEAKKELAQALTQGDNDLTGNPGRGVRFDVDDFVRVIEPGKDEWVGYVISIPSVDHRMVEPRGKNSEGNWKAMSIAEKHLSPAEPLRRSGRRNPDDEDYLGNPAVKVGDKVIVPKGTRLASGKDTKVDVPGEVETIERGEVSVHAWWPDGPDGYVQGTRWMRTRDVKLARGYKAAPTRPGFRGNPPTFTVLESNSMIGKSHYRGTFETQAEAEEYARKTASRSRKFVSFEVWTGSPQKPGRATGVLLNGAA